MEHYKLLEGWGHGDLVKHMKAGGSAESYDPDDAMPTYVPALAEIREKFGGMQNPFANQPEVRSYKKAGYVEPQAFGIESESVPDENAEFMRRMMIKMSKAYGRDIKALVTEPRALTDFVVDDLGANLAGGMGDLINLPLEAIDYLREQAAKQNKRGYVPESVMGGKMVPPKVNKLAMDDDRMFSAAGAKKLNKKYGLSSGKNQTPMLSDTASLVVDPLFVASPLAKASKDIYKGAKTVVQEGLPRASEMAVNAAYPAMRRPFTPVDITVEGVGPDLGKYKSPAFQDYITDQTVGKGTEVPLTTIGGRKTKERRGQGVYLNEDSPPQLETNPMKAFSMRTGDLSTDKKLRADVATAGRDLNQEAMAAHRFLPIATNNMKDASAILIGSKTGRPLTKEEVILIGQQLKGMIVSHNPRTGSVFVAPFQSKPNAIDKELLEAQAAARNVLGKDAKFQLGRSDEKKDLMYMHNSTYEEEGARAADPAAKAKRQALRKMDRSFVDPAKLRREPSSAKP